MVPELGHGALLVALGLSIYGAAVAARSARSADPRWLAAARHTALAQFLLVTGAALALEYLLVTSDFSVRYVANTSVSTSPLRYKIAGLWGALEGSILLWEWLQALFVVLVARRALALRRELAGYALAVLFGVSGVFLLIAGVVASPFERLPVPAAEGRGLNPLLEVTDMLIHPLLLYTGYVGFVVPYAFAMAALLAGRLDATWLTVTRRWTVTAWLFLTGGVLYGGWWSYRTLGWGGYWAWDPVENASFMPWLMGTAFVHSVMVQERRPMLKIWNLTLITLTFALTIFGTFLTRSGVLSSVHAFAGGAVGPFLLGYFAVIVLGSLSLLVWRWGRLGERAELDALLSRESVFLINNVLLVAFCFTVFFGTIFPLLSEAVTGVKVSVGAPYFNWVTVPILLVMLLLMGAGPLVPWRRRAARMNRRRFSGQEPCGSSWPDELPGMSALPPLGVTREVRSRFVHAGFAASARWYDPLTRVFSFGLDGRWRHAALEICQLRSGQALLDVATGTGELVREARRALGPTGVAVGLDFCGAMLNEANRKERTRVSWVEGQSEALPFRPATFDCVTLGFALRHLDLERALGEIARVLKPGGRFVVLEWTRPESGLARHVLLGYMRHVVPPLVGLISWDRRVADLARYLPWSIEHFISGERLGQRIEAAGLAENGRREYLLGLVSICLGVKADPRGGVPDESASHARGDSGLLRLRARQKRWVILAGGVVLGIVAIQLILSLVDLLAR